MLAAACGRPAPPPATARTSGTIEIAGLSAPVRVVRDRWGVPHIYAQTRDDLFAAQGFVQAQDRLFQMDLWRRSVQGRLSEVLGANFIERDAMTRRIQYRGDPDAEWAGYGPGDARAIATAFTRGINAWVSMARERPSDAFVVAGWKPSYWVPTDLLNRTDAFIESGDAIAEVQRRHLDDLIAEALRRVGAPPFFAGLAADVPGEPQTPGHPDPMVHPNPDAAHVRAAATAAAAPDGVVRVSESHRGLTSPSARYIVHLSAPGWNVIGATAPWRPGVAIGHNDRVAWAMVPIDVDTQDIVIMERGAAGQAARAGRAGQARRPGRAGQAGSAGGAERASAETSQPRDTAAVTDAIVVKGRRTPFVYETEYIHDGVVVASDREHHRAFALQWSGFEAGAAPELASIALDTARDWTTFRAALARWKMPPRRVLYADADGNVGYQDAVLVATHGAATRAGGAVEWATIDTLAHAVNPGGAINASASRSEVPAAADALFAHPLAITMNAQRRFAVGPLPRPSHDDAPVRLVLDAREWDRSRAISAPGQSESNGAHFADLAKLWSAGEMFPLVFTDAEVKANAEATLMLVPRK